VLSRSR